jgi:DNA-directed RNA polymerase specialized sigma24 family protein
VGDAAPCAAGELNLERDFEALYLNAWPRLYRYTWLLVRNHEDAEDAAGEAVRRAYGAWQQGRGPSGDALAWLFLIARRVVIDRYHRSPIRWLPIASADEAVDTRDHMGNVEAAVWFDQLRAYLTPRQHGTCQPK